MSRILMPVGFLIAAALGYLCGTMAARNTGPVSPSTNAGLDAAVAQPQDTAEVPESTEEDESIHPIDKMVAEVEAEYGLCTATAAVYAQATVLWDKEMNDQYQVLMKRLPKALQDQLRRTQRTWLAFRDEQIRYLRMYYLEHFGDDASIGSMFKASQACEMMLINKRRVEDLSYSKVDETFIP